MHAERGMLVGGIWSTNSWNKEANLLVHGEDDVVQHVRHVRGLPRGSVVLLCQLRRNLMLFCVKFYFHTPLYLSMSQFLIMHAIYRVSLTKVYTHSFVILNYCVVTLYAKLCPANFLAADHQSYHLHKECEEEDM